jgi:hypothetical protein
MYIDRFNQTRRVRSSRFLLALAVVVLWCAGLALAGDANAQTASPAKDPSITIARTVNPRIAYRGIPKEDMPIAAEATTFPQKAFQTQIDNVTTVGDEALGMTQAGGEGVQSVLASTLVSPNSALSQSLGTQGTGGGAIPRGLGATIGGSVGSATSNIGATVTGALNGALGRVGGAP